MVLSNVANAKDIWCWTRETSQGAVYEYYLMTETFQQISSQELQIDIKIVRKDRWGRLEKPRITVWNFTLTKDPVCTVRDKHQNSSSKMYVKNNPMAFQILQLIQQLRKEKEL